MKNSRINQIIEKWELIDAAGVFQCRWEESIGRSMFKESILYIGFAQSLFAAFVLGTRQKIFIADKIFILCLLTIAFRFLVKILSYEGIAFLDPDFSASLIPMTFGPYLFLYTKYLISGEPRFARKDLLHFAPVVVIVSFHLTVFRETVSFNEVNFFVRDSYLWARILFGLTFFSSVLIYTLLTFQKLNNYRKELRTDMSYASGGQQLIWLNFVAILFSSLFAIYVGVGGVNALTFSERYELAPITNIGLTTLAYAISYFGLRQPSIFVRVYEKAVKVNGNDNEGQKDRFSAVESNGLIDRLEAHMRRDKPYLNAEVTLADLATELGITKYDLTYLLNDVMGKNFFTYINEFRINDVIEKLENPAYDHLTIMSIAYECGFKAKSTFNGIFKQHTGLTPTQFKRNIPKKVQMN